MTESPTTIDSAMGHHWDDVYETSPEAREREWHVTSAMTFARTHSHVTRALEACERGVVCDVGCGSSALGAEALRAYGARERASARGVQKVILCDRSSVVIDILRQRYKGEERIECVICDARACEGAVASGTVACAFEKGSLDAMCSDDDRRAMLREMKRMCARDGVIVSVSFASAKRFAWLSRETEREALGWRFAVVAKGDPARGHAAVFVSVMYKKESEIMAGVPFVSDALTEMCVERMKASGSLYEDADDGEYPRLDFSEDDGF